MSDIQSFRIYREHRGLIEMLSDEQRGKLFKALMKFVFDDVDTDFSGDNLLYAVYLALKAPAEREISRSTSFVQSDQATSEPISATDEITASCCVENVVLEDADYCMLVQLLNQESYKLSQLQRSILLNMLEVRRRGCRICKGQPFIYTQTNYECLGATFDDMKGLRELLEKETGIMWHDVLASKKKGRKYTRYFMNEAELMGYVEANIKVEPEIEVVEEKKASAIIERPVEPSLLRLCYDDADTEVMKPDEELALKVEEFVTPTDLTNDEQTLLYLLNEASKIKSRQMVGNKFVCTQDYLTSKMNNNAAKNIQDLRESLVEKGYIQTERRSWYDGYIYKIIKYPDYLKNKAS